MDERMSGVSHGGERGETGSRMGGGTKERWKKKKRGRGGTNEQRSGEVEMEERSGVSHGGERGKTGSRMGGGAKEKGKKKEGGGKWGSEEVKERRYLFRHKRATDLAEAEESRGRGAERAARSGSPFRVQGGLLRKGGGKNDALPNDSAGRRLCCGGRRGQRPSFLRISFGRACLLTMMEVVL